MRVLVLPKNELYSRAAEVFVETAQHAIRQRGILAVALSGGSTPKNLYHLLASQYSDALDWQRTHVFFSDERCVPPDDPDSNYRMACETLLSRVVVPPESIHRMKGEDDPQKAADEYAQELEEVFGKNEIPRFDLLLLGIGEDCHTASIFPGSDVIQETARTVAAPFVPKLNAYRLTLTPPVLRNARRAIVLAVGPSKSEAVKHAIKGAYEPEKCPAQLLRDSDGEVIWMLDIEAAARLQV